MNKTAKSFAVHRQCAFKQLLSILISAGSGLLRQGEIPVRLMEAAMELAPEMFKRFLPLPVTVITTVDEQGVPNAAPYSCVMPVLRPYPLIAIASALPRDTLRNIRSTREFVVNVMGKPAFREAMQCAKEYPPGINELEEVGLETVPSRKVSPPRIKAAVGWIEAELEREVSDDRYVLILGHVLCSEMNDCYLDGTKLTELPVTLLIPHFRSLGDLVDLGDGADDPALPLHR